MSGEKRARLALQNAQVSADPISRSLWLAMVADHAIKNRAVLVGGSAVNLYTGSYTPTDIDMTARLDQVDREALEHLGFVNLQGDRFRFEFGDGELWLLEFPDSQVDGEVDIVQLSATDSLMVIRLESLIIDRLLQATDQTTLMFDEAVRLCVATHDSVDWTWVDSEVGRRDNLEPRLGLPNVYHRVMKRTLSLLGHG